MAQGAQPPSGNGRVAIVTGPTSGIGKEIARGLALQGFEVILACRNAQKGEVVRDELARVTGNASLRVRIVDLADLASVRAFAQGIVQEVPKLNLLVNNAGVMLWHRYVSPDGLEQQFLVNHLAPFLLTNLLLGPLKAAAPSRVVNVASNAHYGGRAEFDNLQSERSFGRMGGYGNSKFLMVMTTYEFARRLQGSGVTVNAVHPGVIRTNLGKGELPRGAGFFYLFFKGPERGAETPLYVATSPELDGVTGKYFAKKRAVRSAEGTYDEASARRLWDVSSQLAGLTESA